MKIRSITYSIDFDRLLDCAYLSKVRNNLEFIVSKCTNADFTIRTIRFNAKPFQIIDDNTKFFEKVKSLSDFSSEIGVRWFDLTFDMINMKKDEIEFTCGVIKELNSLYKNSFVNVIVAKDKINNYAAKMCAELIKEISHNSSNGIDNFRFGISANVDPNTPFFPFSYANMNDSFSIAVETTEAIIKFTKNEFSWDYEEFKLSLQSFLVHELTAIDEMANSIMLEGDIHYHGQDISLSPFPDENISVVELLNLLGVDSFGSNGTQFVTSYLTSILKYIVNQTDIKTVGFNGVMYSLLEDHLMCKSNDSGHFSIDSIILYSTVCGCGLDMVPLPCSITALEIASMILDVSTTAIKLNKPLGVRLLPIPEKKAGEKTDMVLDFLVNSKIPIIKNIHLNERVFDSCSFEVK